MYEQQYEPRQLSCWTQRSPRLFGALGCAILVCTAVSRGQERVEPDKKDRPASVGDLRRPMVNPREMPLYTLHMEPEFGSTWLFGSNGAPSIPAGFFGEGSDPWSGAISCVGIPLDPKSSTPTADLVVRHEAIEWVANPEKRFGPREIPKNFKLRCEMARLRERGTKPLIVTYDGGKRSEEWEVEVVLAKEHPGGGLIEITWLNSDGNGGLADIELAVKVEFVCTNKRTSKTVSLTSDVEWLSETNHPFTRWADPTTLKNWGIPDSAQGSFIPASRSVGGKWEALAACSKNTRVEHSFTVSPSLQTLGGDAPGTLRAIKQFAQRTD